MILADTSVWVDFLRRGDELLQRRLEQGLVCIHAFVIGELACGSLKARDRILELLQSLPAVSVAAEHEVLHFIEKHELMGRGIGYVDAHLLAAVALDANIRLWTRDKRLNVIAHELGLGLSETPH